MFSLRLALDIKCLESRIANNTLSIRLSIPTGSRAACGRNNRDNFLTHFCEVRKTWLLWVRHLQGHREKLFPAKAGEKKKKKDVHYYHRHFLLLTAHCLNRQKGQESRKWMVGTPWQGATICLSQDHGRAQAPAPCPPHPVEQRDGRGKEEHHKGLPALRRISQG